MPQSNQGGIESRLLLLLLHFANLPQSNQGGIESLAGGHVSRVSQGAAIEPRWD